MTGLLGKKCRIFFSRRKAECLKDSPCVQHHPLRSATLYRSSSRAKVASKNRGEEVCEIANAPVSFRAAFTPGPFCLTPKQMICSESTRIFPLGRSVFTLHHSKSRSKHTPSQGFSYLRLLHHRLMRAGGALDTENNANKMS